MNSNPVSSDLHLFARSANFSKVVKRPALKVDKGFEPQIRGKKMSDML